MKPELDESAPKRRKMISVADEVPRNFGKLKKELPIVVKLVDDSLKKLKDSLDECENTPEETIPAKILMQSSQPMSELPNFVAAWG